MSTNQSRSDNKNDDNEKPGTSASFLQVSQEGVPGQRDDILLLDNTSDESSPNSFLKARNASRERPNVDPPDLKRQRISLGQVDDEDQGIRMETESSSSEGHQNDNENQEDRIDVDSEDDSDSLAMMQGQTNKEKPAKKTSSRRSSNADEGVSTTIPLSSPRQRSELSKDQPDSHTTTRFAVDDAIASTSAAAMAPPLSRMMENSPMLDSLYRLPIFETEDSSHVRSGNKSVQRRSSREVTPAPGTSGDLENLYFQKNSGMDVNENQGPEAFLQKMHGKQRLMWARKLFFLSTELVFPGFKACSDSKTQMPDYMGVRVRSSVMMQALLYADALFFVMWILSFLSTCDIMITVLKQLHGYLSMCLTCLFIIVNILRLRFGLKGNESDEVQYLALFWMTTVIVQIPLFTFIFLTDLFCPVLMAFTVTMDGTMMVFILLESVIGFIHFRSLLRDELNVIRMARRSKDATQSRPVILLSSQRRDEQEQTAATSKLNSSSRNILDDGDSTSDTDSESESRREMDFRMHIRRLSETQRSEHQNPENDDSDSSEQVTSTSDTIRQRPIRAH